MERDGLLEPVMFSWSISVYCIQYARQIEPKRQISSYKHGHIPERILYYHFLLLDIMARKKRNQEASQTFHVRKPLWCNHCVVVRIVVDKWVFFCRVSASRATNSPPFPWVFSTNFSVWHGLISGPISWQNYREKWASWAAFGRYCWTIIS